MRRHVAAIIVALVLVSGCGSGGGGGSATNTTITVFAASSLTGAFTNLAKTFERQHPDSTVRLNLLSSADLASQIEEGAPADVFASADQVNMQKVVDAHLAAGKPRVFAHNRLEIIVAPGNPHHIDSLKDLARPDLVVSLCVPDCPAGRYARQALAKAGVHVHPDSEEIDVKSVSTRIESGQADAGIGYASDVVAADGDVAGVPIPRADNVVATYPIVRLSGSPPQANAFIDLVLSDRGQAVLKRFGFLPR